MSGIKIFHTTSNYNKVLPGQTSKIDQDIGVRALWTSVVGEDEIEPCCKHHLRVISLGHELFVEWALDDEWADWTLMYVNETPGNATDHKFYKYVLFLSEKRDELLKGCKGSKHYQEAFTVRTKGLLHELGKFYRKYFRPTPGKPATGHFHICVLGGSAFDQYQEENEAEWSHLRPDLPKVHQREAAGADSEPESLSFSEIFRKFAFENDEPEEGEWTSVRSKKKAKDGCLPFCFEANAHIFPDSDGVFRHYCRAEAIWVCKRKLCGRAAKEPEGKPTRTTWCSFNSWYHQHLKDHEGQGLRKGFERQYCKQCWAKSKEWVEGQISSFSQPGRRNLDDKKGWRPPHDPEYCEMCRRLRAKGFEQSCSEFSSRAARGEIVVVPGEEGWIFADGSAPRQGGRSLVHDGMRPCGAAEGA